MVFLDFRLSKKGQTEILDGKDSLGLLEFAMSNKNIKKLKNWRFFLPRTPDCRLCVKLCIAWKSQVQMPSIVCTRGAAASKFDAVSPQLPDQWRSDLSPKVITEVEKVTEFCFILIRPTGLVRKETSGGASVHFHRGLLKIVSFFKEIQLWEILILFYAHSSPFVFWNNQLYILLTF